MSTLPYGEVITAGHVRAAVKATLLADLAPIIVTLAGRFGLGDLPAPTGYGAPPDPQELPDDRLKRPIGIVVCPGLAGTPTKYGDGIYELPWSVGVGIVVSAPTADEGQERAELYGAAARACILQKPSLGNLAAHTRWVDESSEQVAFNSGVSVWAASEMFSVTVRGVVDGFAQGQADVVVQKHLEFIRSKT